MDPWELFSEMCKTVVEEQNVYLDVLVIGNGIEMMLRLLEEGEEK